jgi:hypothetical protein
MIFAEAGLMLILTDKSIRASSKGKLMLLSDLSFVRRPGEYGAAPGLELCQTP